ncbi:cupin domain-containing protein [Dankookia rubra]|uniref:Cupin domain-containing protein n=1 Tax=Dankookia rubra TaxID=1442381 RepID=A0A4R5QM73_9PROT|nr:cupin domain-containing protein [Dankookia rubra]TDH64634.1 cupin domain-containing protein [Dankookia rubra]
MPDVAPSHAPAGAPGTAAGGRTLVRHAEGAEFDAGLRAFFTYRDLGMREASGGSIGANVVRAVPGTHAAPHWHWHEVTFQMVYILKGWVRFEYEDAGEVLLRPGDCVYQAPRVRHREIEHSNDLELIEITAPAEFETHSGE